MRVAIIFSGLIVLAVAAAVWLGVMPAEVSGLVARLTAAPAPPPVSRAVAPVPVRVATVRQEDVPITLSGIGTVQAYNTVNVASQVDGVITHILFSEGQDVQAGDPLAIIDPRPFQAQLQQAQATRLKDQAMLEGAVLDLQRYKILLLKDFAAHQQVDDQQALVDQYKAQIATDTAQIAYAQTQFDFTTVRAPISGRVGIRQVDQGNFVHAASNTTIVVITQLRPISVVFTLASEAVAAAHLTPGQTHVPVVALAPDDSTELDRGTIDLVDNQVDQTTGTIKLKASFPNTALKLWPGNFANGRLIVATQKDGLTVPEAALRHGPAGDFIWLVRPNHTAQYRAVTAGATNGGRVLIEKGLHLGETVVTDGQYRLVNDAAVEILRPTGAPAAARPSD